MEGKIINGFVLKRRLGVGGMAEVWYAENEIHKEAAIKILNAELSRNEGIVERFRNEAEIMVKLNHPNIRQVYGYGSIDGRPAIIMEYLDGDDLKARMKQGQRFTDEELMRWWDQLVDALNYTHKKGIVHRDIKPGNIFVDQDGDIKLLDFGIAKVRESISSTQTGQKLGTLMYMSPEQVKDSKHIDYHTDSYSMAVTFVHLISGKRPYDSDTSSDFEISEQIVYKPIDMTGISEKWQAFLAPYLEKDPAARAELKHFSVEEEASQPKPKKTAKQVVVEDEGTVVSGVDDWNKPVERKEEQKIEEKVEEKPQPAPTPEKPGEANKKGHAGLWIFLIILVSALVFGVLIKQGIIFGEKSDPDTDWYMRCYTVDDYREYIAYYGHSAKFYYEAKSYIDQYVADSTRQAKEAEAARLAREKAEAEAAKKAYMDIIGMDFKNTDYDNNTLTDIGKKLYASDIQYLTPILKYNGILDYSKTVTLYVKIIDPNGNLDTGSSSPSGYTYSTEKTVYSGNNNTMTLSGWGSKSGGVYTSGKWTVEVWYEGKRIYKTTVTLYKKDSEIQQEAENERIAQEAAAAKKAYMDITKIEFGNYDKDGNVITARGKTLYSDEMRYLYAQIYYNSLVDTKKDIKLYIKIIKPNGDLMTGTSSPSGYTTYKDFSVETGRNNNAFLVSWGNNTQSNYPAGTYKYEVWYNGNRVYQTTVTIKESEHVFTDNKNSYSENKLSQGAWRTALLKCANNGNAADSDYKGEMVGGKRSGKGMRSFKSLKAFYVGDFYNGEWDGVGIWMSDAADISNCPNCQYYVGGWERGFKKGQGSCYDKYGNLLYDGTFDASSHKPTGTYPTTGNYSSYKFECLECGEDYYVGETYKGKRHGYGIYIWKDGGLWFGVWKDGERDGEGFYISYNGTISKGTWKGNQKQ